MRMSTGMVDIFEIDSVLGKYPFSIARENVKGDLRAPNTNLRKDFSTP